MASSTNQYLPQSLYIKRSVDSSRLSGRATDDAQQHGQPSKKRRREPTNGSSGFAKLNSGPVDDRTQYSQYFQEKCSYSLSPAQKAEWMRVSFPISANSKEAELFERLLPKLMDYLDKKNLPWTSIDCAGRSSLGTDEEIRSTIIIHASSLERKPKETSLDSLREGIMKDLKCTLPIEFYQGEFIPEMFFGFGERVDPLVCGASCGIRGRRGTGTIGGFITTVDDGNNAVYAVTNHHVTGPDEQPITSALIKTLIDRLQSWRDFGIENVIDELFNIWIDVSDIYSGSKEESGQAWISALNRFRERLGQGPLEQRPMLQSEFHVLRAHDHIAPPKDRDYNEGNTLVSEDSSFLTTMGRFLRHRYSYEPEVVHQLQVLAGAKRLVAVEHPSVDDAANLCTNLEKESVESQRIREQYIRQDNTQSSEFAAAVRDCNCLQEKLDSAVELRESPNARIIGFVWESSGKSTKPDPFFGGPDPMSEDWAIIRLLSRPSRTAQNVLGSNMLRPNYLELGDQNIGGVVEFRQSTSWDRLRVTKRGSRTNVTVGIVNGQRQGFRPKPGDPRTREFTIMPRLPTAGYFSMPGDSGSWVIDKRGYLVGMVKGKIGGNSVFTPGFHLRRWIEERLRGPGAQTSVRLLGC